MDNFKINCEVVACIVTYNRKEKLRQCLNHLLNQTMKEFDILVVDNASSDGTYEYISEYLQNNLIKYINTGSNLGGAGGFNYAIRNVCSNYKYIWIMDDDTYPHNTALEALYDYGERLHGEFGFLSSLAEWRDGSSCLMNQQKIADNIYEHFTALKNRTLPLQSASFVSLFFPSSEVYKHGLPIKEFFLWGDDTEFTRRLSSDGGFLVLDSLVLHDMAENDSVDIVNRDINRVERYYLFIRNRVYMAKQVKDIKELFKAYLSAVKQTFRVLFVAENNKLRRIRIIWKGVYASLRFNPPIEYLKKS